MSQGANGPGMTERSSPVASGFDPGFDQIAANNLRKSTTIERKVWSPDRQKNISAWTLTRSMLQILDEGLTDRLHEWQKDFLTAFLRADANAGMLPIEETIVNRYPSPYMIASGRKPL